MLFSFAAILAALFSVAGFFVWLVLRLAGKRKAGPVARWTLLIYLAFFPLALFGILPLVFSQMLSHASTRPMDLRQTSLPSDCGSSFIQVEFHSRDGVPISGWYLYEGSKLPIAFGHGLFRSRREVLERGCELNQIGHPVLLYDFRRHGTSGTAPITVGYQERWDVLGAVDFLKEQNHSKVVVSGVSMGAVATILAAAESSGSIAAVVADSPFESLEGTVKHHVRLFLGIPATPFSEVFIWNLARLGQFDPRQANTLVALSNLDRPVLLIYGSEDQRMPEAVAQQIYESVGSHQKQLVFFDGARHGQAFESDPGRFVSVVENFLCEHMAGS